MTDRIAPRLTNEQVDDILQWDDPLDRETVRDICRDWLDMQARLGRAEAERAGDRQVMLIAFGALTAASWSMPGATWAADQLRERLYSDGDATQPTEDSDG